MLDFLLIPLLPLLSSVWDRPGRCTSAPGNLTINYPDVYPENADFDPRRCVGYLSNLFNGTASVYDVREKRITKVITIPGITGNPEYHVSGVKVDLVLDRLSMIADAADAFNTAGQNISGSNFLVQYDLEEEQVSWSYNLSEVTNGVYGGYQDLTHDRYGNSFVIGTFPSSIVKVSADGKTATPWYLNPSTNHTIGGFSGIDTHPHSDIILVSDNETGNILRFNSTDDSGTPVKVSFPAGDVPIGSHLDAAHLPPSLQGTVLLVSDHVLGTVVIRSADGKWNSAERLGAVANSYVPQGVSTATVEMGGRIYDVTEFFDAVQNRTVFPLTDITDAVLQLL